MNCSHVLRKIDDHVDGLLPAEEASSVRDHLDRCRDCRETAAASKAASTSLAVWGDLEPPTACFDQILAKIQALPPETLHRGARNVVPLRRRILRWAVPSAAAAAVVVAVFVGMERRAPRPARIPGAGPVSASSAATWANAGAPNGSARILVNGLAPGEERVHIDAAAWSAGVRRPAATPNRITPRAVPASLPPEKLLFDDLR